jgi:hypothetical protein
MHNLSSKLWVNNSPIKKDGVTNKQLQVKLSCIFCEGDIPSLLVDELEVLQPLPINIIQIRGNIKNSLMTFRSFNGDSLVETPPYARHPPKLLFSVD